MRNIRSTKRLEAEHVYRTADPKHPGVAKVLAPGETSTWLGR